MINGCTLHHIGYTVADIQVSARQFALWGYEASETLYDEKLTVELCYLHKPGCPTIELVHQHNGASLETQLLLGNGVIPYHLAYKADDFDATCQQLDALGYERLFDPVPVEVLDGRRICYFHHPDIGYIEMLE